MTFLDKNIPFNLIIISFWKQNLSKEITKNRLKVNKEINKQLKLEPKCLWHCRFHKHHLFMLFNPLPAHDYYSCVYTNSFSISSSDIHLFENIHDIPLNMHENIWCNITLGMYSHFYLFLIRHALIAGALCPSMRVWIKREASLYYRWVLRQIPLCSHL